ncbi:LysR family transcriptional regulator [Aquincola sp. S2]|uniref:LysR family transcriptional regulator n=1 Tax=Pseudaquabacterium terrae TaxID=2732868 RepID=A0ABX2EEI3_9BURK|nr:LysR family transcriptional regulator [Aquabacterium terrae]NRF67013.1 LysR family transcriptional regulator [Aquabacterium terrae]
MSTLPSLRALRCFDASARHSSFTRAAVEVHLTQGAVSHQILGLEAQLGVPLFLRRKAGLQLTAAGRGYWAAISPALRQIERATQDLAMHRGDGGSLNLSVASSFGAYWLIPRLAGFIAAHPEITLNLATHVGPVDLAGSPHDAAIEFCDGPAPGLHATRVLPLVVRPYAAPHRVQSGDLKRWLRTLPLIRVASVPLGWAAWLRVVGLEDAVPVDHLGAGPQYDLLSMALNGAIAGLGIALLPDYAASSAHTAGQLVQLSPLGVTADKGYYLRYPAWKADLVPIRRFEQWLTSLGDPA